LLFSIRIELTFGSAAIKCVDRCMQKMSYVCLSYTTMNVAQCFAYVLFFLVCRQITKRERERERDKESDREKEEDILQYINLQRNNKIQNDDSKVDVQTVANAIVFV